MIWLIGCKGMLGTELSEALQRSALPFVSSDREVSITDQKALSNFAAGKGIRWIVNCAAYTSVDRAEDEVDACRALNVAGPENIANTAEEIGASFLHMSTDYVFDGMGNQPYREEDPTEPTGVYGRSKVDGEQAALATCSHTVILRTAWLYGKHGPNFVHTMLRLMKERDSLGVVADQKGSPTWARDLAETIVAILRSPTPSYGIYHYTDGGETTWFDFAREIQRLGREQGLLSKACEVLPLTSEQYPTKARRPAYSVLSKNKVIETYRVRLPNWQDSLRCFMLELNTTNGN